MNYKKRLLKGVGLFVLLFSLLLPSLSGVASAVTTSADGGSGVVGNWIDQTQLTYNGQTFTDYVVDNNWTYQSAKSGCFNYIHKFDGGTSNGHLADPIGGYFQARKVNAASGKCINDGSEVYISINNEPNSQMDFLWQDPNTIVATADVNDTYVLNKANGQTTTDGLYYEQGGDSCKDTFQINLDGTATYTIRTKGGGGPTFNNSAFAIQSQINNAAQNQTSVNGCNVYQPFIVKISDANNARAGLNTGNNGPAGTNCNQSDSSGVCQNSTDNTLSCNSGVLDWIVCPVITLAMNAAKEVDSFITNTMDIDVTHIFDNTSTPGSQQNGYYQAWNSFRILATALVLIGGLAMVIAQGLGFDFLDAYTVRKVLPRLLVAAIGISLSWPLMRYFIELFDVIGFDVRALIYYPFSKLGGDISVGANLTTIFGSAAALLAIGPAALTFVVTALLAVFIGFLILVVRQIGIILIVIMAPIAIASYVLPNTQRLWKLWRDNFLGLMLMFPIISAFIAIGHVFSAVSLSKGGGNTGSTLSQVVGIVAYFLPYFLLPAAFRLATGSIGALAGFVNDRHRGAFNALKGVRRNAAQRNWQVTRAGKRFRGGTDENFRGAINRSLQRGAHINRIGVNPTRWGARMDAAMSENSEQTRDKMLEDHDYTWKGDDALNRAASESANRNELRRILSSNTGIYAGRYNGANDPNLERDIEKVENLRGRYGNSAFRQATWTRAVAGGTAYQGAADQWEAAAAIAGDDNSVLASLVAKGRSASMEAGRVDAGGAGFGDTMTIARNFRNVPGYTPAQANADLTRAVVNSQGPGVLAHASMKPAAVQNLVPELQRRITDAAATGSPDAIDRELAYFASIYDSMAATSPNKAQILADQVMRWDPFAGAAAPPPGIPGVTPGATVQRMIEGRRNSEVFQSTRREYSSATPPGVIPTPVGPGTPGGPPITPPPSPSDTRLKRNVAYLHTNEQGIRIYRFQYLWSDVTYVGVMAQELLHTHPHAVVTDTSGFYKVKYDLLGFEMLTLEEWESRNIYIH